MSAFIVSAGSLLEIRCPSVLNRQTEQQVSFRPTLGGKRKAFIRRGGRRTWSVDVAVARRVDVSTLEAVARNMGPYGWYPPEAVRGNLLSPQASAFDAVPEGATGSGLVQLSDGTVASSIVASGTVRIGSAHGSYEMVPVLPGAPVTVGAWGLGGCRFQGFWRDAAGDSIGSYISPMGSHLGWQWRDYLLVPPPGSAFIELQLFGGSQYALPSVAWGSHARAELGTGSPNVIFHSPSYSPLTLSDAANFTGTAFQVAEVG